MDIDYAICIINYRIIIIIIRIIHLHVGRCGLVDGWLAFGSEDSGLIPSAAFSHIILHQPSAS